MRKVCVCLYMLKDRVVVVQRYLNIILSEDLYCKVQGLNYYLFCSHFDIVCEEDFLFQRNSKMVRLAAFFSTSCQ